MNEKLNVISHLKTDLSKFGLKYLTSNNKFRRSNIIHDLRNYDNDLLSVLLNDSLIRDNYLKNISGIHILQIDQLIDMLTYSSYIKDSYTKYANSIGLAVGNYYLDDDSNVVLNFPYKDTVLKAGMTKEDQKHDDEPFLNDVIAKPQIDELFEPKIFTDAKKYDSNGVHSVDKITDNDNLMVKGNNLIALHSLLHRYAGKVKLIYIDPPYNTGNDSFQYNDQFNHATWLVFMKNRLEIAKKLLSSDGSIFISCDDHEMAYLKVLMDEIFGRNNYVNTISIYVKNSAGASGGGQDKRLKKNVEYLIVYSTSNNPSFNKIYSKEAMNRLILKYKKQGKSFAYTHVLLDKGVPEYLGETYDAQNRPIKIYKRINYKISSAYKIMKHQKLSLKEFLRKYGQVIFRTTNAQSSIRQRVAHEYVKIEGHSDNVPLLSIIYTPVSGKHKGQEYEQFYKGRHFDLFAWLKDVSVSDNEGQLYKTHQLGTLWNIIPAMKGISREGQINFNNGKKPEQLIANIIKLATSPKDLVLDFFAGSATTQAVAMKMHRRFIGVEQMDYPVSKNNQEPVYIKRLQNVISGEQNGVSKNADINWQGGGSFIYVQLKQRNQKYMNQLKDAKDKDTLDNIYKNMKVNADIQITTNLIKFDKDLPTLDLATEKSLLKAMLDKNELYYDYYNIDDANVRKQLSDSDYQFNKSFYKGGDK